MGDCVGRMPEEKIPRKLVDGRVQRTRGRIRSRLTPEDNISRDNLSLLNSYNWRVTAQEFPDAGSLRRPRNSSVVRDPCFLLFSRSAHQSLCYTACQTIYTHDLFFLGSFPFILINYIFHILLINDFSYLFQ